MSKNAAIQILVVDDEISIQKLLKRTLQQEGYFCHTAGNVAEAKRLLQSNCFDLLLSDLVMPGESGIELISYAKEHFPDIGRVMVTTVDDPETAKKISAIGIYGYVVKPIERNMMLITVENALRLRNFDMKMRARQEELEEKIWGHTEMLGIFMDNLEIGVSVVNSNLRVLNINNQIRSWFPDAIRNVQENCYHSALFHQDRPLCPDCPMAQTLRTGKRMETIREISTRSGLRSFRAITSAIHNRSGKIIAGIELLEDITDRLAGEEEQRKAQRLETIGQLAAGIVHEINSPIQYLSSNMSFLQDAYQDIEALLDCYQHYFKETLKGEASSTLTVQKIEEAQDAADIEFLKDEIPITFKQSFEGINKVSNIVRAMKEFAHPGEEEKVFSSINEIVDSAVTISRNEWKYVADVEMRFDLELPPTPCLAGDLGRVVLNLIVNAAHAIADTLNENNSKGKILICTENKKSTVNISISDNGKGIPKHLQEKIFESFFTTKERGKGTGQGLAMAKRIIEEKHDGSLYLESETGKGSTFFIELPVEEMSN